MNVVRRAWYYTSRKRGKSLIIFFCLTVSGTMLLSMLGVQGASFELKKQIQKRTETSLEVSRMDKGEPVTEKDVDLIQKRQEIIRINRNSSLTAKPVDFSPVLDNTGKGDTESGITLHFCDSSDSCEDFVNLKYRMIMGDPISGAAESGRAVISKWLAKQNSLTVGDKLTVRFLEGTEDGDDDRAEAESERTVTVSGIFESPGLSVEQQGAVPPALRMENQIFADFSVSKGTTAAHEFERVSFYLEDPEALDAFAEELYESFGGRYEISDRSGMYDRMKGSLEQAGRLTEFLIAVTILASGLTLFLILSMWIRDRKKELAIYLSMGYGKANICMQVMAEGSGILLAAFLPSVLAGGKAAGILAGGIIPDMTDFAAVQVSITGAEAAAALFLGMLVVWTAAAAALLPVLRMNPRAILAKNE